MQHADLHRIDAEVFDDRIDLIAQDFRRNAMNRAYTQRVLSGQRSNRRHAVTTQGGKGFQVGLKTFAALGCYGMTAITALTAQNTLGVRAIHGVPPEILRDQIDAVVEDIGVDAVKIGMLHSPEIVQTVAAAIDRHALQNVVVDPVMVATSGGKLLEDEAVRTLTAELLPLATLITPNMDEARVLWERDVVSLDDMAACARDLSARFGTAVLVKGGHLRGDAADVLCHQGEISWHTAPRTAGVHTHGTGCTFSAAIATGLAHGLALNQAVAQAKQFVSRAIAQHFVWQSAGADRVHALNHLQQTGA